MEILVLITEDEITESFLSIVRYGLKYIKMINFDVLKFWSKIFKLQDENLQWQPALLIIEICLCGPISNASLEILFNQMNLVKSTVCNRLKKSALNTLLTIKVSNVSNKTLHKEHVLSCFNVWYKKKRSWLSQEKRKTYKKWKTKVSKRPTFDFSTKPSSSSSSSESSDKEWRTCKWTCNWHFIFMMQIFLY